MKPEQKKAVNRTILQCRAILERDIENRLITYGILIDEPWIEKDKLSLSDEQEQIYKNLREAIGKEMKGGLSQKEALISYIREVTYTYLNRIAALRVMEVRGLMEEVLIQREEYGGRSYGHRNFFEIAREYCKSQSDEGLAYFISLIFNEIASDIGLLFNTDDEYSIIGPSNQALLEIIHHLTTEIDEESWHQDEIIGWIYQYFNEEEKDDVFDRLYNKKEKIKSVDIPAATQLFTPDWIVEWIINNSLGKLREEIISGKREYKKLEEIKLLDPACGSGHFLVKAYDLFYQYYVEDGYPKEEIPFLILKHNLYGIDIDARAIQLTALILYIKVRTSLKDAGISQYNWKTSVNLVCADAILLNGERLEKMKKQFSNNKSLLEMIDIIYEEFTDTRLKGSLIQPEKRLIPIIESYKKKKQNQIRKKKKSEDLGLFKDYEVFEKEQEESVLTKSENELFDYLNEIYRQATVTKDINNVLFANEARKSLNLLNIFLQKYDVVVTNPPYMGKRSMSEQLKQFVSKNYKLSSNDLYSVFIQRCQEFLSEDGKLGMITQATFLFISSFEKLRSFILKNLVIENLVLLGSGAFDDISGEKVNTAMFVISNSRNGDYKGQYITLEKFIGSQSKHAELINPNRKEYFVEQREFFKIDGYPISFWIDPKIRSIFESTPPLSEYADIKQGLATGNNKQFVRFWWEVNPKSIGTKWIPYNKGGGSVKYLGTIDDVVLWENNGYEIKQYSGSVIRNENYYFKEGITYSLIGGKGFSARYLSSGHIFDVGGSCIFTKGESIYYLLGYLNSRLATYLLNTINPTINYQVGDLKRLPYKKPAEEIELQVSRIVKQIIDMKKAYYKKEETSKFFNIDKFLNEFNHSLEHSFENYLQVWKNHNDEIKQKVLESEQILIGQFGLSEGLKDEIQQTISFPDELIDKIDYQEFVKRFISIFIGVYFGRYTFSDISTEKKEIFVLKSDTLEEYFYEFVEKVFGEENLDKIIFTEIPEALEDELENWLTKDFFNYHIKIYQKRPIYWHICSPKKTFNALIYYHSITPDTLYKVKSNYLKPMMDNFRGDLSFYREKMSSANNKKMEKKFEKRVVELEKQITDLEIFDKQIDEIIATGYEPDIDQGVLYNIKPLNPILAKKIEK